MRFISHRRNTIFYVLFIVFPLFKYAAYGFSPAYIHIEQNVYKLYNCKTSD